jgi:hypothetical protein
MAGRPALVRRSATHRKALSRAVRHRQGLQTSSILTLSYREMYQRNAAMILPKDVIALLNKAGVGFVLMGAHAISGWMEQARATDDVDVLIQKRHHKKAVRAIQQAYPKLQVTDHRVVTRFTDLETKKVIIDLMKPSALVLEAVFKNKLWVEDYFIPDLEMALAMKFAAMVSPHGENRRKHQDTADFMAVVENNRDSINRLKLRRLGEKVYRGGGNILQLVDDTLAGRQITI